MGVFVFCSSPKKELPCKATSCALPGILWEKEDIKLKLEMNLNFDKSSPPTDTLCMYGMFTLDELASPTNLLSTPIASL